MFQTIHWLFFDVGSTLVDEHIAYSHRFHDIACLAKVPYALVEETAKGYYRQNQKGDKETARHFGVSMPRWHTEDEILYPDAFHCLEQLHMKYKIGIIANQTLGTKERLHWHGILPFIDLVIASAEEGVAKPDNRIFEIALERSACLPQNAVMIGDRIDNDIIPARQIGMKTIWIRQGYGKYWNISNEGETPDCTVNSLAELCTIL